MFTAATYDLVIPDGLGADLSAGDTVTLTAPVGRSSSTRASSSRYSTLPGQWIPASPSTCIRPVTTSRPTRRCSRCLLPWHPAFLSCPHRRRREPRTGTSSVLVGVHLRTTSTGGLHAVHGDWSRPGSLGPLHQRRRYPCVPAVSGPRDAPGSPAPRRPPRVHRDRGHRGEVVEADQIRGRRHIDVLFPQQPVSANGGRCWNWFLPDELGPLRDRSRRLVAGMTRSVARRPALGPVIVSCLRDLCGRHHLRSDGSHLSRSLCGCCRLRGCEYEGLPCFEGPSVQPPQAAALLAAQQMGIGSVPCPSW